MVLAANFCRSPRDLTISRLDVSSRMELPASHSNGENDFLDHGISKYPTFSGIPNLKLHQRPTFQMSRSMKRFCSLWPLTICQIDQAGGLQRARNGEKPDETHDKRDEQNLFSPTFLPVGPHPRLVHLRLSCEFSAKILCKRAFPRGFPSFNKGPKNQATTLSLKISARSHLCRSALATLALSAAGGQAIEPTAQTRHPCVIGGFQSGKND